MINFFAVFFKQKMAIKIIIFVCLSNQKKHLISKSGADKMCENIIPFRLIVELDLQLLKRQ